LFLFLVADLINDKKFANELCQKSKYAISEFLEQFCDELYFIASKFNNRGIDQDSWEYRTKTGYSIHVNDDISESFLWLQEQAINKSCSYKGKNGATFSTYITIVLNSNYTFKDWLKWKTGVTGYVPKCINNLNELSIEIFLLLRQKKSSDDICKKLNIENINYLEHFNDIEEALIKSNQIDLINSPKEISFENTCVDDEEERSMQLESNESSKPSDEPEVELIKDILSNIIDSINNSEKRLLLLYWGNGYSVEKIFETFQIKPYENYLDELNIQLSKDIYPTIEKIIKKSVQLFERKYPDNFKEFNLNQSKMKNLFKTYFQYFA